MKRPLLEPLHAWFIAKQSEIAAKKIAEMNPGTVLEVGAGSGLLTDALRARGISVASCDYQPLRPDIMIADAHNMKDFYGKYDTVACSNTLEHLHSPEIALQEFRKVGKQLWLTWTPWWSPFGGHEFSPWHYFGATKGHTHKLNHNLYKTTVSETLKMLSHSGWAVVDIRPRYWPMLSWLARWKLTREWATWNVMIVCR